VLRAAVVGAGHQGRYHAAKYAVLPGVRLAAVVDTDGVRAARVAAETGAEPYTDHRRVLGRVDVASVAVPVSAHHAIGCDLLDAGVHVLMEKPIAGNLDQADELNALATARKRVLQIGHLERFSSVTLALREQASHPIFIEARRLGPFTARGTDADVVLDLMIHDIDLALVLANAPIAEVEAHGTSVLSDQVDVANATLRFASGCIANLTASRVSFGSVRRLRLFQSDAYLAADMNEHVLDTYRRMPARFRRGTPSIVSSRQMLHRGDALRDEISDFLEAVITGRPATVSGEEGARALRAALCVLEHIQGQPRSGIRDDRPPRSLRP